MKKLLLILLCSGAVALAKNAQKIVKNSQSKKTQETISKKETSSAPAQAYLLDTIDSVVYSIEGTELITRSETLLPSLQGGARSLNDMIFEILVYFDAKKHKVEPNEDAVDRYLVRIMKENNLKREELESIFSQGGRTYKQGREELKRVQAVNGMIDFKIRSNLIVPRKDVEAYYNAHPEIEAARYELQYAEIPVDDEDQIFNKLKKFRATGKGLKVDWSDPFWVEKDDLAEDKQFIIAMQENEISKPIKVDRGFQIYRMVNKKEQTQKPLDDRYRDIVEVLLQPIYKKLLTEYRTGLFEHASIVRFK